MQLIAGILWPRPLVFKFDQQLPVLFSLLGLVAMGYFIAAVRVVSRRWENPPIPVLWSYAQVLRYVTGLTGVLHSRV